MPKSWCFFRRPVTWCVIFLYKAVWVLMCNVHGQSPLSLSLASRYSLSPSLSACPLLSHSPSLPPATFVPFNVANDCRSFFFHGTALLLVLSLSPPLSLSVCPFSPSQLLIMLPFPSSCSLSTPCSRPSPEPGGGQTKCTFIVCVKKTEKESERDTEKEKRERALSGPLLSLQTIVALNRLAT